MKILADASLPALVEAFPPPFEVTLFDQSCDIHNHLHGHQILLCRSTLHVDEALLEPNHLRYVATASSGTDHIDKHYLDNLGIHLLDAKGSNANAVADYVVACVAHLQLFNQFTGRVAGVVGYGAVGSVVAQRLQACGFKVICYDPWREECAGVTLAELTKCHLICLHANLHDERPYPSRNLIDLAFLNKLAPKTAIINAARGDMVVEDDLLQTTTPLLYCTDVYAFEPHINEKIIEYATLCTPHIAGHSIEAKRAAVVMISKKLHQAYHLTPPSVTNLITPASALVNLQRPWQEHVLALFNPIDDTVILKYANDKEETFLRLRKAHQYRHDFCAYDDLSMTLQLRKILGAG